jgi:hypothetical protein
MLQRSPPVGLSSRQQAEQLQVSWNVTSQLHDILQATCAAEIMQVLSAVLQQQTVCSVGALVAWAQQQPEQLCIIIIMLPNQAIASTPEQPEQLCKLPAMMAVLNAMAPQGLSPGTVALGVAGTSWHNGFGLLDSMLVKATTLDSSSASTHHILTTITEQLEQSGGGWRHKIWIVWAAMHCSKELMVLQCGRTPRGHVGLAASAARAKALHCSCWHLLLCSVLLIHAYRLLQVLDYVCLGHHKPILSD